jgi:serine/threonine protein kinase
MERIHAEIAGDFPIDVPTHFGRYEYVCVLGSGSFSVVLLVRVRGTSEEYACKVCSRQLLCENNIFDRFEREVRILQVFSHPSLIQLIDVVYEPELIFLVMEYCENGDLLSLITGGPTLEDSEVRRIFAELVEGMVYIHSHDIAHRDLKPENILMDKFMHVKIGDFGLCHHTKERTLLKTPCGSVFYAPPEVLSRSDYDGKAADVWSVGVVLYVMSTGALPWSGSNQGGLLKQISDGTFSVPTTYSVPLDSLLTQMMALDPASRPAMTDILKHPWLSRRLDKGELAVLESQARFSGEGRPGMGLKKPLAVRLSSAQSTHKISPAISTGSVAPGPSRTKKLLMLGPRTMSGARILPPPSFASSELV